MNESQDLDRNSHTMTITSPKHPIHPELPWRDQTLRTNSSGDPYLVLVTSIRREIEVRVQSFHGIEVVDGMALSGNVSASIGPRSLGIQ